MLTERQKSAVCWQEMSASCYEEARFTLFHRSMTRANKALVCRAQEEGARWAKAAREDAGVEEVR